MWKGIFNGENDIATCMQCIVVAIYIHYTFRDIVANIIINGSDSD